MSKLSKSTAADAPWAIVLAGGEGRRTRPFIERWLGHYKPKQYCTFSGSRSLFQQTVDRADRLSPPERRISVVAREYAEEARAQLGDRPEGVLLAQPANRGTAPGILLGLTHIHAVDPSATAVIYPSDHFVLPEEGFVETVRGGVAAAAAQPERVILIGVEPETPELDYGWIEPGARIAGDEAKLFEVRAFVEKPSPETGRAILARGGLWNSMVIIGSAATLWRLSWRHVPELMVLFERYRGAIGGPEELTVLNEIYEVLPERDFSRHVLQRASESLAVLPLEGVVWSDWGRPERIVETLRSVGEEPAFSEQLVMAG